jgi:hypothetical protein
LKCQDPEEQHHHLKILVVKFAINTNTCLFL